MEHTSDHVGEDRVRAYSLGLQHAHEQSRKRIRDLEAALREMLQYAYLGPVEGVVYACGAHRDVMRRAEAILGIPEKS